MSGDDEKIHYTRLKMHIKVSHPFDPQTQETFSLNADLGSLPVLCCGREDVDDPENPGSNKRIAKVTPLAQQLGLGATLFMMTTKAMFWFFLWISILNIPTMLFFYTGNAASIEAAAEEIE